MNLQKIDEIVKNISIEEIIKEIEKDEKIVSIQGVDTNDIKRTKRKQLNRSTRKLYTVN